MLLYQILVPTIHERHKKSHRKAINLSFQYLHGVTKGKNGKTYAVINNTETIIVH